MKREKQCRRCELERELKTTEAGSGERDRIRAELAQERHTCRDSRNNRTRGA